MFWPRPTLLRPLLTLSNVLLWCSAAVVLFILAHFVQNFESSVRNGGGPSAGTIIGIIIAGGTILAAVVGLLLSTRATYRGRMLPFSVMLSYIWLAAAVTADTRRKSICSFTPDWCQRIRVAEAFSWLAFVFALSNVLLDILIYGWHLVPNIPDALPPVGAPLVDKRLPGTAGAVPPVTAPAVAPATAPAAPV